MTTLLCLIIGHRFTNETGIFKGTPYCLHCGKTVKFNTKPVNEPEADNASNA